MPPPVDVVREMVPARKEPGLDAVPAFELFNFLIVFDIVLDALIARSARSKLQVPDFRPDLRLKVTKPCGMSCSKAAPEPTHRFQGRGGVSSLEANMPEGGMLPSLESSLRPASRCSGSEAALERKAICSLR